MKEKEQVNANYQAYRKLRGDWGQVKPYTRVEADKRRKKDKHPKRAMERRTEE